MQDKILPKEISDIIEQEAHNAACALYSPNNYDEFTSFRHGWEIGATAYATKLQAAEEEHKRLIKTLLELEEGKLKELERQNEKLKEQATGWRPLLEEVLKLDDLEIAYISEDLINKIKKFLYGE